jgi:hypothetical protein
VVLLPKALVNMMTEEEKNILNLASIFSFSLGPPSGVAKHDRI